MTVIVNKNVGMVSYFPWAVTAPRGDWTLGDDKNYLVDTYPQADALYETNNVDYRVDRYMTSNAGIGELKPFASSTYGAGYEAWKVFQKSLTGSASDRWLSAVIPTEDNPLLLGLTTGIEKNIITKVELALAAGGERPKKVRLSGLKSDGNWEPISSYYEISPTGGELVTIETLTAKRIPMHGVRLEIYSHTSGSYIAIYRMRIYAEGVRSPAIVRDMGGQRVMPGTPEWCLRVGTPATV